MHAVVMDSLEDYLSGLLEPVEIRKVEAHLSTCEMCRQEVAVMREASLLMVSLRTEETVEPSPGFCAGVMALVEESRPAPAFARFFSLDLAFARRLMLASLLTLIVLGGVLVKREAHPVAGISPESIMAQQDSPGFDSMPARDNMLVTLTAYEH